MYRIFKYQFQIEPNVVIEMPAGARILKVEPQHGNPTMWALVDEQAPKEKRHFWIIGTGHAIDSRDIARSQYLTTFQQQQFVWHVFEVMG